jgi:mono/diheme cytochrome c family protein
MEGDSMTNSKSVLIAALISTITMSVSCGGDEVAGPCGEEPVAAAAPAQEKQASTAPSGDGTSWTSMDEATLAAYGERIFLAKGSNTCNDCHGKDGVKGRLEQAANLTKPETWKSLQATGGDTAKADMALSYLISNGGKRFNESYVSDTPDGGWDWSKTDATSFDIQMFGVTQSATKAELKKIRKDLKKESVALEKDDLTIFGTKAVMAYLRSIAVK